jgi:hypothetical protein
MQRYEELPQQQKNEPIYSVTDGISSFYTKREYLRNFRHFWIAHRLIQKL